MVRKYLLITSLLLLVINLIHAKNMENKTSTIRLIYPQWQGGVIAHWMPDMPANDVSRGYYLGSHLLNFLAPESNQNTVEVPVSLTIESQATENGISYYQTIVQQTKDALSLLEEHKPERIVTLGGDCAVSIVPFTYLASKYPNDVAIVWIDAHPDVTMPGDEYQGYHAMALTACIGLGDEKIINMLPGKVDASKALLVGLRSWDEGMKVRQEQLGIKGLSPQEVSENSEKVIQWLKNTGASKVVIHLDLDVLDPTEIIAAVGTDPDGMKIDEVVRVINDISKQYDLIGLTIAEPMPRVAIKLKNMMNQLPLIK